MSKHSDPRAIIGANGMETISTEKVSFILRKELTIKVGLELERRQWRDDIYSTTAASTRARYKKMRLTGKEAIMTPFKIMSI
jgi:RNA-binding protein YhbY